MVVIYQDADRRLEVEGLEDPDTPMLVLQAVCRRCAAVLFRRDLTPLVMARAMDGGRIELMTGMDAQATQQHACLANRGC